MLVSHLIEDLKSALGEFPIAADWRVGIATYVDGSDSDITIMSIASYSIEQYDEVVLVPEGMGAAFKLEERPFTAAELLASLSDQSELQSFVTYAKTDAVELPDGRVVSSNMPLWGTGVKEQGQLVYFYYGRRPGS